MFRDKDKQIVQALRENSRMRLSDIAKRTGIPISTVHERLQKLVKQKAVKLVSIPEYRRLRVPIQAWFFIKTKQKEELMEQLSKCIAVNTLMRASNGVDVIVECMFQDFKDLHDFQEELEAFGKVKIHPVVEMIEKEQAVVC